MLRGRLESDDDVKEEGNAIIGLNNFGELEADMNWTERVIDVRNWFKFRADEFYKDEDGLRQLQW